MKTVTTMAPETQFDIDSPGADVKRFFDEHGFVVVRGVFDAAELQPLHDRIDSIVADPETAPAGVGVGFEEDTLAASEEPRPTSQNVRALAFMARYDAQFREVAQQAELLGLVRNLIGEKIKVFRDQMLLKPPGGQDKPPHQDQSYFRVQPVESLVTAWIALNDATFENGCMAYVSGSHRPGVIFPVEADPLRPVHHIPQTEGYDLGPEVLCPVPAGSVIFHHGLTLHRSGVNHTEGSRRALIFHYATAASRSENESLNREITIQIDEA